MRLKQCIKTLEAMEQHYINSNGKAIANGGTVNNSSMHRLAAIRYALIFMQREYDYLSRLRAEGVHVGKKPKTHKDGFRQELYGNLSPVEIVEMMGE